jgi:DNA gyrase subunit A
MGVVTARIVDDRGELVGALMVSPEDEVFAITSAGGVIRTTAAEVKQSGRQTMGVRLMNLAAGDSVVAVARNAEAGPVPDGDADEDADEDLPEADEPSAVAPPAEAGSDLTAGGPQDG